MINLTKSEADIRLNDRKETINIACMNIPVMQQKMRVALCLDFSASMRKLYDNGTVQEIIERIFPLALQFDDNGEMEVWIFENGFNRLPTINRDNYYGYVDNYIIGKYTMHGTYYAPVIGDIKKKYITEEPMNIANYVIFITDGDNSDRSQTDKVMIEVSKYPIFFQFVGIGNASFKYLDKLDNLSGRYVDNANFFSINDIIKVSDGEIYSRLLKEVPIWLSLNQVVDMINNQRNKSSRGIFGLFHR